MHQGKSQGRRIRLNREEFLFSTLKVLRRKGMVRHLSDQVAFSPSLDLHRSVVSQEGLRPWKDGRHLVRHGHTSNDSEVDRAVIALRHWIGRIT